MLTMLILILNSLTFVFKTTSYNLDVLTCLLYGLHIYISVHPDIGVDFTAIELTLLLCNIDY